VPPGKPGPACAVIPATPGEQYQEPAIFYTGCLAATGANATLLES
jgi:hypothetical protein